MDEKILQLKADETSALLLRADGIVIKDAASYQMAAAMRAELKTRIDWFENFLRPDIQKADQLHKSLLSKLNQLTDAPRKLYQKIGFGLSDFDRRAEEEKRRLEREAERKRKEAEAEQQRLAALAAELGSPDTAEEIEETPVDPGPVITKAVPPVEGLHYRHGGWGFKITIPNAIPDEYWVLDNQRVQGVVSKLGKQAEKVIPGIEVFEKPRIPIQK